MIDVGDVVELTIEGVKKRSKVFGISKDGLFAKVDYYYGDRMVHKRNASIPIIHISLVARAKTPSLSDDELKLFLKDIMQNSAT